MKIDFEWDEDSTFTKKNADLAQVYKKKHQRMNQLTELSNFNSYQNAKKSSKQLKNDEQFDERNWSDKQISTNADKQDFFALESKHLLKQQFQSVKYLPRQLIILAFSLHLAHLILVLLSSSNIMLISLDILFILFNVSYVIMSFMTPKNQKPVQNNQKRNYFRFKLYFHRVFLPLIAFSIVFSVINCILVLYGKNWTTIIKQCLVLIILLIVEMKLWKKLKYIILIEKQMKKGKNIQKDIFDNKGSEENYSMSDRIG